MLLDLDNITLLPTEINVGTVMRDQGKFNFAVADQEPSLPIFTSPMESVVGNGNWQVWSNNGIRPVLPRTESLEVRLEACNYIFAAFSKEEVKQNFLMVKRNSNNQFRICIDSGNGHDTEVLSLGSELKRIYGPQAIIMGGNIGNPRTYIHYCKAGFDFVRVGISSGSLVEAEKFGFTYPMASLLIDINSTKTTAGIGIKQTKIIADGGIKSHADILKCLALGADYVMIGREFAQLVEANGEIYRQVMDNNTKQLVLEEQDKNELYDISPESLHRMELIRVYKGNTSFETQSQRDGFTDLDDWMQDSGKKKRPVDSRCDNVNVVSNLQTWLKDMYECFNNAFIMTSASDWRTFKNNVKHIAL